MKVTCQKCSARFKIDDAKIPEQGLSMKCPKCAAPMVVRLGNPVETPVESDPVMPDTPDAIEDTATAPADDLTSQEEQVLPPEPPDSPELGFGELDLDTLGQTQAAPDEPDFGLLDNAPDENSNVPDETAFDSPPAMSPPPEEDEFSLDMGLDDMDDALSMDDQESLPPKPEEFELPELSTTTENTFDEAIGSSTVDSLQDVLHGTEQAVPSAQEDDFSLDMPSLLENAAAELEREISGELSSAEELPQPEEAFPDDGFSFDDMLGQSDLVSPAQETGVGEASEEILRETVIEQPSSEFAETISGMDEDIASDGPPLAQPSDFLSELGDFEQSEQVTLYQIRRDSGKVFGPFPSSTVEQMIQDGKLTGSEEISVSGGEWQAIETIAEFSSLLPDQAKKAGDKKTRPEETSAIEREKQKVLEQQRQRRRAGSLDVVTPMKQNRFRLTPKVIIPLVVVLLLLVVSAYMEFVQEVSIVDVLTGHDVSDLPLVEQLRSKQRKVYDSAVEELEKDSYQGFMKAREITQSLLANPDFRGVEAVWALSARIDYEILMRFSITADLVADAKKAMTNVEQVKRQDPEITFAKAAQLMYEKQYPKARDLLKKVLIGDDTNLTALHMISECYLHLPEKAEAEKYLAKAVASKHATVRTYYLQGSLAMALNDFTKARAAFEQASKLSPEHLDTQIEIAGLSMKEPGGLNKAERELQSIRSTFTDRMSKKQLARLHYYAAQIYKQRNEPYKVVKELSAAIENEQDNYLYNLMLGEFYMDKHEYGKSQEQYGLCLKNNPVEIRCHIKLGENLLILERADQALFKLEEAAKIEPNNARIYFLIGKALEKLFKPGKALEMFEKAIKLDPNGVEYYTSAAMSYLKQDNLTKAGEYIQKAKLVDANSPLVHNFLGQMHLHQNDVDKAIEEFKRAIAVDRNFIVAHHHLADTYRKIGKYEDSLKEYETVLNLDDKSDKAYYGKGRTYFLMGEVDKAIAEYEKALNLNSRNYEYYHRAGLAYYSKGDKEKARSSFEKALELSPSYAESAFYLGRVAMDKGAYDRATEYFDQAMQLDKQNPDILYYNGWLLEKQEKFQDALDFYDMSLKIRPKFAPAYLRKGITLREQNKYPQAIAMFRKANKIDPTINTARIELGDCYFEMKRYKQSIKQYKDAIKLNPDSPEAHLKLGMVYQEMGNPRNAVKYLKRAVDFDFNDPVPHLNLGYAFKALRKRSDAVREFETYLELNPTAIDRQDVEDEIYWLKNRR